MPSRRGCCSTRAPTSNDTAADGNSALVLAAFAGHPAVARVLIDAGADPNAAGAGYTALHAAALRGDLATVQGAAREGRQSERAAHERQSGPPLRLAVGAADADDRRDAAVRRRGLSRGRTSCARCWRRGAESHARAAERARRRCSPPPASPVEKEARPSDLVRWNVVDNDTPQVPRAEADVLEATRLLLDAGADVNQANEAGDTALHAAAAAGMTTADSVAGRSRRGARREEQGRPDAARADAATAPFA